ncbi:MAG: YceI family protein [Chitinophagaceae bacterium]
MKLSSYFAITALSVVLLAIPKWKPEADKAQVNFKVKGPFGTVNGKFSGLKADIKFDEDNLKNSSINASIDAKSVSTGVGLRNRDLRKKEEWLNTDKYPTISFHSTKIEKKGKGYVVVGELTLKNKTKETEIPFTFSGKGNSGIFNGKFTINREDFDVGKKGGTVGKTITIELKVPVRK